MTEELESLRTWLTRYMEVVRENRDYYRVCLALLRYLETLEALPKDFRRDGAGDRQRDLIFLDNLLLPGLRAFVVENGPDCYGRLLHLVGIEEAKELLVLPRKEIITRLAKSRRFTYQQIADVFGLTRGRIRQIAPYPKDFSKPPRPPQLCKVARLLLARGVPVSRHRDWLEEYLLGMDRTQAELAKVLGVSQQAISNYCLSLGLRLEWRRGQKVCHIEDS